MKKIILWSLMVCLSITFLPKELKASSDAETIQNSAAAKTLINRLEDINTLTKSDLSPQEKNVLRKEVKSIEHRLRAISGGIYISVGALLIIIVLLIILL